MAVAIFIGVVGYSLSKNGVMAELKGSASETIIIQVATLLSQHGFLAIVGAGITLAGILACTMSTADSQLLAASSAVSENLLKGMFGVNLTEKRTIHVARATVLFIAVIAVFLAGNPDSSVFGIVLCVGWIWRCIRTGGPCGIILETFQQDRCSCRHDRRRSHGICMEILRSSVGRCMECV